MNYLELAQTIVTQAATDSVEVEAYLAVGSETTIQVRSGEVEKLSYAGSKGLGIRVIKAGQMGYAYTSDFSESSIAKTVATALTLLK